MEKSVTNDTITYEHIHHIHIYICVSIKLHTWMCLMCTLSAMHFRFAVFNVCYWCDMMMIIGTIEVVFSWWFYCFYFLQKWTNEWNIYRMYCTYYIVYVHKQASEHAMPCHACMHAHCTLWSLWAFSFFRLFSSFEAIWNFTKTTYFKLCITWARTFVILLHHIANSIITHFLQDLLSTIVFRFSHQLTNWILHLFYLPDLIIAFLVRLLCFFFWSRSIFCCCSVLSKIKRNHSQYIGTNMFYLQYVIIHCYCILVHSLLNISAGNVAVLLGNCIE